MSITAFRVFIEFNRIQTYLFAVPKLRTVLGANALMGEMLRLRLPALAVSHECGLPQSSVASFLPVVGDPLNHAGNREARDDPGRDYARGILAHDGGHFQALFIRKECAIAFADAARKKIEARLPGLMFEVKIERWQPEHDDRDLTAGWKPLPVAERKALEAIHWSPGQDVCQWSGQEEATHTIRLSPRELVKVSRSVKHQWVAGTRFAKGKTQDIIGLIQNARNHDGTPVLPCRSLGWEAPKDLKQLAGGEGRYLALVYVDGNRVGNRSKPETNAIAKKHEENDTDAFGRWLASEAQRETFFHSMRTQVRCALVKALGDTFAPSESDQVGGVTPYQLLMVGGDDLLLLTRAKDALPFVTSYAEALAATDRMLSDNKPLDVGAGVVIAQPSLRFHALHALAEELATSAKRLARGPGNEGRSVVDWAVLTPSAAGDIQTQRRLHEIVRYRVGGIVETLVLSARPYSVLPPSAGDQPATGCTSLQQLLAIANELRGQREPVARSRHKALPNRSQLKALPDRLRLGRHAAIAAIADLPEAMRKQLSEACGFPNDDPWVDVSASGREDKVYLTRLLDLLEVTEIPDLGVAGGTAGVPASIAELQS